MSVDVVEKNGPDEVISVTDYNAYALDGGDD